MADSSPLEPNPRDRYAKSPENGGKLCLFPTLVDAVPGKAYRMVRCVPVEHLTDLGTLYKRDRSDLASLIVAAWSIVLHQFVNSEVLYFGVDVPKEISGCVSGDVQPFTVIIDPDSLIEQLLRTCHRQLFMSQGKSGNIHFNTGVLFIAGDGERSFRPESSKGQLYATDNEDYDLLLIARACNNTVEILLHYSTAVVSDPQAAIIGGVVSRAIESIFGHPDQKLRDIDLLDQQSKECIAEWNSKQTDIASGSSIAKIIQEKARYQSGAPAVCSWDGTLTYGKLEELSTTLAIHLKEKGVGPEVMVPVCFEKTMWAIVATLAVLKAGAAFVPIDPSRPLEYLKQIIAQVNAKVILSSERQATLLEGVIGDLIAVSGATAARLPTANPMALPRAQAHNMACVLFTSGSTGNPKGCVISHGALAAVSTYSEALQMRANTRALQFASFSFAISLNEIFCTLAAGGTICIPSGHERMNDLSGAMFRMGVNWAMLTPSLMGSLDPDNLTGLKTLIVGGEPLRIDLARSWSERVSVVPAYGMTEWVGVCTVQQEMDLLEADSKSIGKSPIANLWLVNPDNHHVLAPIGAVAELLIEGPCLARGYLNDAERTAMAFIENPPWLRFFRSDRETRLYKTGDLVRYSPDGSLIYMGRKSLQAKIRGQRIELGEVEHQVSRHLPGATKVIVDVITPIGDNPSPILVAFVCLKNDGAPPKENGPWSHSAALFDGSDQNFQSHSAEADTAIRDYLPDYMIPHIYVPLKYVPLTISGKVDRHRLKEIAGSFSYDALASYTYTRSDPVAPSSRAEQRLHLLLSEVLKLPSESFGVNESFFRLGGDSLKAIQLVTQCRAEGITITVEDVFREQTVSSLALLAGAHCGTVARHGEDSEAEFSLSPVQRSMILAEAQDSWFSPTACIFLRLNRRIDSTHLENAIRQVVSRHPMLRARFTRDQNGGWAQYVPSIASEPQGGYECASCTASTLDEASEIMKARRERLDIEKGPLFVALLLNLSGMQYLSLAAHALIVDHTSWEIISKDIECFLDHDVRMHKPKPQPLGFREWCSSELEARHGPHMIPTPAPITPTTVCGQQPSQRADSVPPARSHSTTHMSIPVPSCLLGDAPEPLRLSSSVVLQAVVLHAFSRAFEDRELPLLTVEEDGRGLTSSHGDFSQTVGQFTTNLTLCVQSYGRSSFGEILCQTKESYHQARNGKVTHLIPSTGRQSPLGKSVCAPLPGIRFRFLLPYHEQQWRGAVFEQVVGEHLACPPDAQPAEGMIVTIAETDNGPRTVFTGTPGTVSRTDLERWVRQCEQSMDEAVKTVEEKIPIFTPCDFPLLALTNENIQDLLHCRLPAIAIHPSDVEAAYPCSPIQQGILISQARRPEHYQALFIWEVASTDSHITANPDLLQSAWLQLTRRHSMLRTIFVEGVGNSPYIQVILKADAAHTAILRCADDDDARSTLHAHRQVGGHGRQSLPRFTVCQTERGKLLAALEISHLLMDATSMEILKRDLALACKGKLPTTSGAPYRDYIAYLERSRNPATLKYWSSYLAGCSPCYFPRLNDGSHCASLAANPQSVSVPFEYRSELNAFCRGAGLTISNVVQVAWGLVLHAFTGLDSVLFGYLTSGRDVPVAGIEDAVGPYINVLVCRIDIKRSATLLETAQKNQRDFMQGVSSQHLSLTELIHSASDGGHGMFNTCMSFPPEIQESGQNEGHISFQELEKLLPNEYDITVECRSKEGSFTASLVYLPSTLSESQATRIAHNLSQAIATIIQQSGMQADAPLLSEMDRRQLEDWNRVVPARVEGCVHHLIAKQCRALPDAPAVCAWDGDFTYSQLDRESSALAAHLAGLGVRPEVFVPLLFEKSRWTTVAMLGVMKAGGGFVLLDPSHPRARLQSICRAVSADIAIASASQAAIAEQFVTRVVALGLDKTRCCESRSDQMTVSSVAPNNALYAVFTSGSTGVPKGAIVTHACFSTGALSYAFSLGLTHKSRVFQFSSYAFDNSISDILTTLLVGGCVCIPSESARRSYLAKAIQDLKATLCFLTPSVARLLPPEEVPNLSTVILTGEALTGRDVDQWADRRQLYNEYGTAECSVVSTIQHIAQKGDDPCNIGRGTGCVSWVVDRANHDKLLPIGATGELLIEGPIVGRGYLNDPERTVAAFIDSPAWLRAFRAAYPGNPGGDRVYKTGDLVQYAADGSLRFVGRKDTQVKLRGQRIELGEVEHHVRECFAGARDVVAEVVTPADGRPPMLVAFVWVDSNRDEGMEDILAPPTDVFRAAILTADTRLHDAVPEYMVPAVFLPLVEVPLMATGKTDRRRLRERAAALSHTQMTAYTSSGPGTAKRAPSTAAQRTLQQLWAQVLNLPSDSIGADDSFFRLGGDSITAMQLTGAARQNGLFLAVADVFHSNTLATLASRLESPGAAYTEMVDWEEETALDPSLPRADPGHIRNSESISVALTGSTGFLGRELLRQLVTNPRVAYIHCLAIRPGRSLPPDLLTSTKIIPHSGDLSLPRLGLNETEASQIFSSVAAIIHNGADVSRLKSYSLLRGSNVDSTRQLLELCLLSTRHSSPGPTGTPHFHYISTASVHRLVQAPSFSRKSVASFPPPTDGLHGYTAAKWASERILERAAHTLGLRVVIHRPSQITGADVGDRDVWHNIWRWSQALRAVPDLAAGGARKAFDLISVENCATTILCSVLDHFHRSADDNSVDYVYETGETPVPVETFGEFLGNEAGITDMPSLPFAEWVERAVEAGMDELVAVVLRQQAVNA